MKNLILISWIMIFSSCLKEKISSDGFTIEDVKQKYLSEGIIISSPTYQRVEIGNGAFVSFVDVNFKAIHIIDGVNAIKGTVLEYNGKKYYNIVQFTSESKISDQQLKTVIINSYKHNLHYKDAEKTSTMGLLTYIALTGEIFQAEYILNGKFEAPVTLGTNKKIKQSSEIINKRAGRVNSNKEKLMDTGESCTDWYYVETWRNSAGEVIMMKETYLFSTCPNTSGSGSNEANNNSTGKLVCPETFKFKNTGTNWQAAYVKNYKYAFMGTDRMGNPANYYISMNFEVGVGRSITTAENAQRIATRALNIAERKVADKIASGYYSGKGIQAPLLLQKDLRNEMIIYFNRQLGLIDNSSATTINSTRVTALESDGVDAVFVGWFGC